MKKPLISFVAIGMLVGCSSVETADSMPNPAQQVVEQRLAISTDLNATYCAGEGFKNFYEREKYYTFTCQNGAFFNVAK